MITANFSPLENLFVLSKNNLLSILEELLKERIVYGPKLKVNIPGQVKYSFSSLNSPQEFIFDYTSTPLPPKKLFFPPEETLFQFNTESITQFAPKFQTGLQALIGVHPCDIHGILLLDKVFSANKRDPYYLSRRKKTLIIGWDCLPDQECFCPSLGTDTVQRGYDLFITPLRGIFALEIGTKAGENLLQKLGKLKRADLRAEEAFKQFRRMKREKAHKQIKADYTSLPLLYSGAFELSLWQRHADRCFGCGSCIMVCPTCYCFDLEDQVELNLEEGRRKRRWDGCMLSDFALLASGENFRKTKSERLRHRFNRKFQFHMLRYGKLFCVGCGRCARACLAEIKPVEVTNEIIAAKENL